MTASTTTSDTRTIHEYSAYTEAATARAFHAVGLSDHDAASCAAAAVLGEAIGGVAGAVATAMPHTVS